MDASEQLARLYMAGFDVQTFERFPTAVGVMKGNFLALLQPTPVGLMLIGLPGWRFGENLGVLVERSGRKIFQYKELEVEATPELLQQLGAFREELQNLLSGTA